MENNKYTANNLPLTYEEYGEWMEFTEVEMEDEYAPTAKVFYERAAAVINSIKPFDESVTEELKDKELLGFPFDLLKQSLEHDCMTQEIYDECMQLYDDMCECEGEEFMVIGFVFDLFTDLYDEFLE